MSFREDLRRFFSTVKTVILRTLGGVALFTVFVISAFAAMRLAIHGREVAVPNLANLSDADAETALSALGLHLSVENRFYAPTVPANHVLSQSPVPGSSVRRGWQIRVTESLGPQQVDVPDVTGQDEHPAEFMLRRLQLELGTVAHIPGPSPAGAILAQSPPPNTAGLDGPRVALLVSDDESAPAAESYVMPSIVGLTIGAANARLSAGGLHVSVPAPAPVVPDLMNPIPLTPGTSSQDPAIPPTIVTNAAPSPSFSSSSVITSQSPLPGHRVSRAEGIHVTIADGP